MTGEWTALGRGEHDNVYNELSKTINHLIFSAFAVPISYFRRPVNDTNLPRYRCRCDKRIKYFCPICTGRGWLTYSEALKSYNTDSMPLTFQIPQCHICSKFETEGNPLFAYALLERENDYKFIYRCENNHGHDSGMTLIDLKTNLEVHL